jgi:uncharacterized Zn finger protein
MGFGYGRWAPYVPVAEHRKNAEKEVQKLRKQGKVLEPVVIDGRQISTTVWGQQWCRNMESYRDYESRLPRGRSYAKNGAIVDLKIEEGKITALVNGSSLYKIAIDISKLPETAWRAICKDCAGGIDSMIELLQGRLSKNVMERLCRQVGGLFPCPSEIRFSCSCPDHAEMCKHVAAALYGIGARLDHKPELLFRLRAVKETDLLQQIGPSLPVSNKSVRPDKVLQVDDMSALFGIELAALQAVEIIAAPAASKAKTPLAKPKPVHRKISAPSTKAAIGPKARTTSKTPLQQSRKVATAPQKPLGLTKAAVARKAIETTNQMAPQKAAKPPIIKPINNVAVRSTSTRVKGLPAPKGKR